MYVINEKTKIINIWADTVINKQRLASGKYGVVKYDGDIEEGENGILYAKGYAPKKPLDELKSEKHAEINQLREQARKTEGASYNNDLFDIDETSQSNILAQIKVAELLNNAKATYIYRSKTNQNHSLTVTQLQELGLAIAQKVNEIYQKSWNLKAQVDAAETEEEIKNITW